MKFKVKLRLTQSGGNRKKFSINLEDGQKFMVGRATPGLGSDLTHPSVSSNHCMLTVKDGLIWVTDNQSRNGTFLNHKRVDASAVKIGDILQIGEYLIEFLDVPMPEMQDNQAGTQFIDLESMSEDEQAALKRVGVGGTQIMNREEVNRHMLAGEPPALAVDPMSPAKAEMPALEKTAETSSVVSPDRPRLSDRQTDSVERPSALDLGNFEPPAETPAAREPFAARTIDSPAPDPTPEEIASSHEEPAREERAPTELLQPVPGERTRDLTRSRLLENIPKADPAPAKGPSEENEQITQVQTWRREDHIPEAEEKRELTRSKTRLSDPTKKTASNLPPAGEKSAPAIPERPRAIDPDADARDTSPDGEEDQEREDLNRQHLVSKHLKKPSIPEPPIPASLWGKKGKAKGKNKDRARDEVVAEDPSVETPRAAARKSAPSFDPHVVLSTGIAATSFALAAGLGTFLAGSFHLWIPPVAALVGAGALAGLAGFLTNSNEFMEADGDFRDYYRTLAFAALPMVVLGVLSRASALYRVPFYIIYGVVFFNLFMSRFKPLAERFLVIAGSYVASAVFLVYLASNWETILNSRPGEEVVVTGPPVPVITESAHVTPVEPTPNRTVAASNTTASGGPAVNAMPTAPAPGPAGNPDAANTPAPEKTTQAANPAPIPTVAANTTTAPRAPTGPDSFTLAQFLEAANQGRAPIVKSLIQDKNVSPNTVSENGMTALMYAAYNNRVDVAKVLVEAHADINMHNREGTTALMWAAWRGHREMSGFLIQAGADLSAKRSDGDTALDIARRWGHPEIANLIENPGLAKAIRQTASTPPAPPQTVNVVPPPTQHPAKTRKPASPRQSTKRSAPAAAKRKPAGKKRKRNDSYSATEGDDDTEARARAVRSLHIGQ